MGVEQNHELRQFGQMYRELDEIYHELAVRAGLSDSAFLILYAMIEIGEGCLQKDIARQYSISPQTVHSSVRVLERKGCLYLKPGKKRDMHIYLTDEGKRILEERLGPIVALENEIFQSMPADESRTLLNLTRKYLDLYRRKLNPVSSEAEHRNVPSGP